MPPVEAPQVTAARAPVVAPKVVKASPNVRVSEDLASACKLNFNDTTTAPKFAFDESAMGAQDVNILSQVAKCVSTGPLAGRSLELVGRADRRGKEEYNQALGERRATSVREYLSGLGVDPSRLTTSSRGELEATGTDEDGWQRDRRVDVLLR